MWPVGCHYLHHDRIGQLARVHVCAELRWAMTEATTLPTATATNVSDNQRRVSWACLGAIVLALVVGVLALVNSNEDAIGPYGLIEALPVLYFIAVGVVIAVLVCALRWKSQPTAIMTVGVISLVVLVHGSAGLLESQARFGTAWLHAGFAQSLMQLGHTSPYFDARFSWPGFFSGAGVLTELSGFSSPTVWLRFAPVVFVLCYIPPLLAIGRAILPGWRAPWIGVMVFMLGDWVGQDYFSPQTVTFILYLTIVAIALTYFRSREPGRISEWLQGLGSRMPRGLRWLGSMIYAGRRDQEPAQAPTTPRMRLGLLVVIVFISFAIMSSHQLTPIMTVAILAALAVLGRLRPWPIFVLIGVATLSWINFGATAYWSNHLQDIFGGFGKIGSSVDSGVGARIEGSAAHLEVLNYRIGFALFVWGLAGLGAIRLWWSGKRVSVPLLVVAGMPVMLIAGGSYGGEGLLRVFLFSLPGSALLISALILPLPRVPRWRVVIVTILVAFMAFPVFLVAIWGNEDFEHITTADLQLRQALYQMAPPGATIVTLGPDGPDRYQSLTLYNYAGTLFDHWPYPNVQAMVAQIPPNSQGTYVVISQPAVRYGVENLGTSPDLGAQVSAALLATKKFTLVYQNSAGEILRLNQPPPAPTPTTPGPGVAVAPSSFRISSGWERVR